MDKSKELLTKRALAPSAHDQVGAMVTVDIAKLSAEGHYLRGVVDAISKYRTAFEVIARNHVSPAFGNEIMCMLAPMYEDELRVTVAFAEEARKCGGTIQDLKIGRH